MSVKSAGYRCQAGDCDEQVMNAGSPERRAITEALRNVSLSYPKIWCNDCYAMTPMSFKVFAADEQNPIAGTDLVCDRCKSIAATLYER